MIKTPYKKFFHTLGNRTRLAIIYTLKSGEKNVTELTKALKLKQTTISHNLRRLEQCQFVKIRQDGPFRYYSLNNETIEPFCDKTGLELYLEIKDFPMVCAATIKELHDTGKVPEINVDGVTINITYRDC